MTRLKPSASPKHDVAAVADVQAPIHAGLGCNGTETADVADVATTELNDAPATSATACKNMTLQRKAPIHAGCTPATSATSQNNNVQRKNADVKPGGVRWV